MRASWSVGRASWVVGAVIGALSAGAQTWAVVYDDLRPDVLVPAADGGVLVFGRAVPAPYEPVMLRLEADGDPAWRVDVGASGQSVPRAGVETPSGFLVVGGFEACSPFGGAPWMALVDPLGSITWQKCMTSDGGFAEIESLSDGGFAVAGEFAVPSTENGLVRLDASGNATWARSIPAGFTSTSAVALSPLPAGGTMFATAGDPGNGHLDAWFFAFDAAGSVTWQRAYGDPALEEIPMDMIPMSDGGAIVSLDVTRGLTPVDFVVARLGATGDIVWATSLRSTCFTVPMAMAPAMDGGVVIVGSVLGRAGGRAVWIAHVTDSGLVDWNVGGSTNDTWRAVAAAAGGGWFTRSDTLHVTRLNESGLAATDCTRHLPVVCATSSTSLTEVASPRIPRSFAPAFASSTFPAPASPQTFARCAPVPCPVLSCGAITVTPPSPCASAPVQLAIDVTGGEAPILVEWDFDGDTLPDASGNPVTTTPGVAGAWEIIVTASDACSVGAQECRRLARIDVRAGGVGEVSNVRVGAPPLRLRRDAPGVRVERVAAAASYSVYVDALGSWYSPMSSGLTECGLTAWTDDGDGTITLDVDPPTGTWVLVTASDDCGEGTPGADSRGRPRVDAPGWASCP